MTDALPKIAVLGAAGLIGEALCLGLAREGFPVLPVARRFAPHQRAAFGAISVTCPVTELDAGALASLLDGEKAGVVVNCLGVLQDSALGGTEDVHVGFVSRLIAALKTMPNPPLLIHVSVPGEASGDATPFSRTKRQAEQMIAASGLAHIILRPGFVLADAAFGGGALMRALAMLPVALPEAVASRPFMATGIADIISSVNITARRWQAGERSWAAAWDVMARERTTVGTVVEGLRRHLGGPAPRLTLPGWAMDLGAMAGDLAGRLGWQPPIGTTALAELRRGIAGDPEPWIAATGIAPASLAAALAGRASTVQERWFARLYLAKALIIGTLVVFWCVSGLIALTVGFEGAASILITHGWAPLPARLATAVSSLMDFSTGLAIGWRRTCRAGLLAGIGLSLFYMAAAAVLTPDLWIEPLGALVKTGPAIVLMLVALAMGDNR